MFIFLISFLVNIVFKAKMVETNKYIALILQKIDTNFSSFLLQMKNFSENLSIITNIIFASFGKIILVSKNLKHSKKELFL